MLSKLFGKDKNNVEERLIALEHSLLHISSHLKIKESADERNTNKILQRLDFLIKEKSKVKNIPVPDTWKKDIDTMIWDLVKAGKGSYPDIRLKIAFIFLEETGIDLYKEARHLRETFLKKNGSMSESTKSKINVTRVLEENPELLQIYWNLVYREHEAHAKRD